MRQSHYVAQAGLQPPSPQCWDYRCMTPCLAITGIT
jgi:hypothetical protein